jgi:DNA invertase Pin-like site-specific DNA recombinase
MQRLSCVDYCEQRDYQVVKTYIDYGSGRTEDRPQFKQMMLYALHRQFEMLIVWKMDRLSRGTIREVLKILEKLSTYKIEVISVTEPYLSTDNPSSELIMLVMAWCANQESKRIGERVAGGIKRWEQEHPGERWHSKKWNVDKAIQLREQGLGWRSIEKELRKDGNVVTWATIRNELLSRTIKLPDQVSQGDSQSKS